MKTKNYFAITVVASICFLSLIMCPPLQAQNIGINGTGGTAHPSALLDIDAVTTPSLGVLIPRIALQAINLAAPVSSPATSLLVYNTASASTGTNAVSAGYYYWDATKWVRFAYNQSGNSANNWNTIGNAGTTAGTNFLGTSDAQDLVFKTNNSEAMRVTTSGNVGIGITTPTARLDVYRRVQASNAGDNVFGTSQGGSSFDLIGTYSGWDPTAIYIGGYNAYSLVAGSSATKVYFGGVSPASNLKMLIDLNTGNVGINSLAPSEKLEVQGSVKIVDGTQGLNKVLTSDAAGKASWKESAANTNRLNYSLAYPANVAMPALASTISLGSFTVTTTGIYRVLVDATIPQGMILCIDGASPGTSALYATVSNRYYAQYFVYIAAGTHVLRLYNDNNGALANGGPYWTFGIDGPIN